MAKMVVSSSRASKSTSTTIKEQYNKLAGNIADYSKYFLSAPEAPKYYTPTIKSDGQMLKEATDRYAGLYDTYISASKKEREQNISSLNASINALGTIYGQKAEELRDTYKQKEKDILNDALSKGMGRSSYVADSKRSNSERLQKETNYLNTQKQLEKSELERGIAEENLSYENARDIYNAKRDSEINKLVADMKREQDKSILDAQEYNNNLYKNYQQLLLNQLKHNLNVQKYIDSLNTRKITVTKTTSSSYSTTYKPMQGVDREAVEALWSRMNDEQKVKYVDINKSLLRQGAPDLYSKYVMETSLYSTKKAVNRLLG